MTVSILIPGADPIKADVVSLLHLEDGGLDHIDLAGLEIVDYRFDPELLDDDDLSLIIDQPHLRTQPRRVALDFDYIPF